MRQKIYDLIAGNITGRTLFHPIVMHFAARFHGTTYSEFASDHRVLVESNIRCLKRYDYDAVSVISDPYRETSAFGGVVEYPLDAVPVCMKRPVKDVEDVEALSRPDLFSDSRTRDRIEAVALYRELLGDSVPVIGWVEGPLAEACDLAGVNEILLKIALEPDFVTRLMDKCLLTAKDFAKAQVEAGSDIIGVGDAICSQISPIMYETQVFPLHRELFEYIHSLGAAVKLHICGDITHILPKVAETGADIIDIDWMVDMDEAFDIVGERAVLCGNLDPVSVIQDKSEDEVYRMSRELVEKYASRKFILSGGCEITVGTSHENMDAMRRAVEGQRPF